MKPLINQARTSGGLPALRPSAKLNAAARAHAADMARHGHLSHVSSGGRSLMQRVRGHGYGACHVAENIARGQRTAAEAIKTWMNSERHRRQILSGKATHFGAARATGADGPYWVQIFGRPGC